jgi:glyoxylase-like metal-dependent hydrolase (beta-lactamase superfamily II)
MSLASATPRVDSYFHADTNTFSYLVDDGHGQGLIIDPVLDFDLASARTWTASADLLLAQVRERGLQVHWILETHAHADHLSAGAYLRDALNAQLAIGRGIVQVQQRFKALFDLGDDFVADGRQFDRLLDDGDLLEFGALGVHVLATPGHTDDGMTYLIGDAAFIGDTLFAPETGTARADFPGGSATRLYGSLQRLLGLPAETRLFLCHDYPKDRAPCAQTSVAAQRDANIHVGQNASEATFVQLRETRDASLPVPRLLLPALQVNIRGGRLPAADANGVAYLRLPLNQVGRAP